MKEDKIIKDWLENELKTEEIAQMEKVISFTEKLHVPVKTSKEDAWSVLLSRIESEPTDNGRILTPEASPKKSIWLWVASTAAVILVTYFSFFNTNKLITETAIPGQLLTVTLPDKSTVTLNSETTLSYKEKSFLKNRSVALSGEAFFEVTPGSTFKIMHSNSEVKVLGTSFNVYNRNNELNVSVFSGKVEVSSGDQVVRLNKGEQAKLEKGKLLVGEFNPEQTATWRNGHFYFDAEPLSKVVEELERQFDIEINVNTDISERFYSGYFSKTNLTEALQLVFVPMGISFHSDGNQVTIE